MARRTLAIAINRMLISVTPLCNFIFEYFIKFISSSITAVPALVGATCGCNNCIEHFREKYFVSGEAAEGRAGVRRGGKGGECFGFSVKGVVGAEEAGGAVVGRSQRSEDGPKHGPPPLGGRDSRGWGVGRERVSGGCHRAVAVRVGRNR